MFLWFVFWVFGKVATVLKNVSFPQFGFFLGGGLFLFIWVWKVEGDVGPERAPPHLTLPFLFFLFWSFLCVGFVFRTVRCFCFGCAC